ncbi:DVU_1556 family methyltransferase [Desulfonatronum sp. SC1]|uniref:DVU_1556 family methyltransferase n=1 Tax=Desulfonatronum sp. SC1 TaxID=2109626 RepID=UPI000D31274C|nr:class I SAM-dependent methyltransferase [Desulfonatronum sp. SC1]PTN37850.1 hypothetical protein C6366_04790 [Desulfonatronum sp. SC1]
MDRPDPPFHRCAGFRRVAGETLRPGGLGLTERMLELSGLPPGSRILDMGCGLGVSARHLMTERRMHVTALDLCREDLLQARRRDDLVRYIQADMNHPPLRPGLFDALLCECVLSLSPDPGPSLNQWADLIKPGGRLLITDIYLRFRQSFRQAPLQPVGHPRPDSPRDCFQGAMTETRLRDEFNRAGFRVDVFEDHSRLLAELTAKLIFAGLDREGFPGAWNTGSKCSGTRPGYCMLLAVKHAAAHDAA